MIRDPFRPFEILRLIRDGQVTNLRELRRVPVSHFIGQVGRLAKGLKKLGLIEIEENGNLKVTESLKDLLEALDLSLAQLSDYSAESTVCSPAFGLPSDPPVTADVFVLMPFLQELKPVYDDHIRNVAKALGVRVARADDFFTAESIVSDIWNGINACRVVLADCTGRNPNVFYEIGVAHTLGKPVVLMSQTTEDIPFDIQHMRTIVYEFTPRGMRDFEGRLTATLKTEIGRPRSLADYLAKYEDYG